MLYQGSEKKRVERHQEHGADSGDWDIMLRTFQMRLLKLNLKTSDISTHQDYPINLLSSSSSPLSSELKMNVGLCGLDPKR